MAFTTTRDKRADRWRTMRGLMAATVAVTTLNLFCAVDSIAQVKAPAKSQFRAPPKSPTDSQADQLNEKWLSEFNKTDKSATADKPAASDKTAATTPPPAKPATEVEDERVSSVPNMVALPGVGARTVVTGSAKLVKANGAAAGF